MVSDKNYVRRKLSPILFCPVWYYLSELTIDFKRDVDFSQHWKLKDMIIRGM